MTDQIPHGPDHLYCPMWRKKMSKVCHTCPMWTRIKGQDPNQEIVHDTWNCALAWLPTTTLEAAQQSRQTCATVASARDEIVRSNEVTQKILVANLQEQQNTTAAVLETTGVQQLAAPKPKELTHADR